MNNTNDSTVRAISEYRKHTSTIVIKNEYNEYKWTDAF